jgi:hypothetical protein
MRYRRKWRRPQVTITFSKERNGSNFRVEDLKILTEFKMHEFSKRSVILEISGGRGNKNAYFIRANTTSMTPIPNA